MKFCGDDILRLIPQRYPFVMVDELEATDATHAVTALSVRSSNYFMLPDSTLAETGLIEHIAQSCSALMGCQAQLQSAGRPPLGLIGEVKHFECLRRPSSGQKVYTAVAFGFTFGSVTLATGESRVDGQVIARAQLKIFVQQ